MLISIEARHKGILKDNLKNTGLVGLKKTRYVKFSRKLSFKGSKKEKAKNDKYIRVIVNKMENSSQEKELLRILNFEI